MRALVAGARRLQQQQINFIQRLARMESPSDSPTATRRALDLAAREARALGGRVKILKAPPSGGILSATFGARNADRPLLLLGHLDTVWPLGTLKSMPVKLQGNTLFGPGVLDMKAGVAIAFAALRLLKEAEAADRLAVQILLSTDEETGSHASRNAIESTAKKSSAVFVLEPAQALAYKTARKGTGNWRIDVHGRAAHAGVDFKNGRSAVLELARQLQRIAGFTDLKRARTVSPGVIGGGTKTNVIPAHAWAEGDLRIARHSDAARIINKFNKLRPIDLGCRLQISAEINRPPMERTRGNVRLFKRAQLLARELDWDLQEASTGGASDGNFTSALGIPTLDGMGAVGLGAHAVHEQIELSELPRRTALLAALMATQE